VIDIGAGTGYFTRRFAEAVAPSGEALGLDIEPVMIDYLKADSKSRA
jgi:ubiquinone/menaquinone biosynthesis C-methylase UbiE